MKKTPERQHRKSRTIGEVAAERAIELEMQRRYPEKYSPIPTHIPELNAIIGGIPKAVPFYWLLTATEKLGKTTIAMDLTHAWRAGTEEKVMYFQLEELAVQYVDRVFASRTSLTKTDIRMLNISDAAMREIQSVANKMKEEETNLLIQDDMFTLDHIVAEMDAQNCKFAVIDNFQLLSQDGYTGANSQERFATMSRRLIEERNAGGKSFIIVSQQSDSGKAFGSSGPDRDADLRTRIEKVMKDDGEDKIEIPNVRRIRVLASRISGEGECVVAFDGAKNKISPIKTISVDDVKFEDLVNANDPVPFETSLMFLEMQKEKEKKNG